MTKNNILIVFSIENFEIKTIQKVTTTVEKKLKKMATIEMIFESDKICVLVAPGVFM